ncbi:uncharacterized protein BDW47DRAFT_121898 [Aspergillus candidus]|uniref:Argonaute complex, subunit Arb1 n=1 Tax=Aspergillus candidus TaxID=41067 RepID=A0A2I2FNB5_ASPCN|nr:Argonaute complex, subunit Arb1 [Aspergillus candidus]PLB42108.1 Argonaute complex, subunit Arb1 [Aspergillus candidus]
MKYLAYGGVNTSQKMFQGVEDRDMKDMDAEDILVARGQATINHDHSRLEIDFNAVVKGFLTSVFPFFFNPQSESEVKLATDTIRNFLSYLLYHDVCPEHKQNIDDARGSCDVAAKEIWKNTQFTAQGPGHFNIAASTLFGGFFYDNYVEDNQWENKKGESVFMTIEVASKVVKVALAGAASYMQVKRYDELANAEGLEAVCVEDIHGFEVTRVHPPSARVREFYKEHAPDLYPVGKIYGKAYRDPGKPKYDLGPEESLEWEQCSAPEEEFEFFVEEHLLEHCYPGMKVMTTVWELNCGFHFFDEVFSSYCSIYTVLANDLMMGWKKPRDLTGKDADDSSDEGVGDEES